MSYEREQPEYVFDDVDTIYIANEEPIEAEMSCYSLRYDSELEKCYLNFTISNDERELMGMFRIYDGDEQAVDVMDVGMTDERYEAIQEYISQNREYWKMEAIKKYILS